MSDYPELVPSSPTGRCQLCKDQILSHTERYVHCNGYPTHAFCFLKYFKDKTGDKLLLCSAERQQTSRRCPGCGQEVGNKSLLPLIPPMLQKTYLAQKAERKSGFHRPLLRETLGLTEETRHRMMLAKCCSRPMTLERYIQHLDLEVIYSAAAGVSLFSCPTSGYKFKFQVACSEFGMSNVRTYCSYFCRRCAAPIFTLKHPDAKGHYSCKACSALKECRLCEAGVPGIPREEGKVPEVRLIPWDSQPGGSAMLQSPLGDRIHIDGTTPRPDGKTKTATQETQGAGDGSCCVVV